MWALLFGLLLFVAVLISCRARETVLSVSVLFLAAGLLLGRFSSVPLPSRDQLSDLAEITLFAVLFSDGMRTGGAREIRTMWRIAGRVLLGGMLLTILFIAVAARLLGGLSWPFAFLIAAVLSPTDPVFVSAIFQVEAVPAIVKRVLNVESGFNDGLALPIVMILIASVRKSQSTLSEAVLEIVVGLGVGIAIPWLAERIERSRLFGAVGVFERLNAFAIGILVYSVTRIANGNVYLAAFSGGITLVSLAPGIHKSFEEFGETVTELLKLLVLLIFGARIASAFFTPLSLSSYLLIGVAVFGARMMAVPMSLLGKGLSRRDVLTIAWFGPKGFASVIYGLMVLQLGTAESQKAATHIGVAVVASILVYSSTDVLIGRWFHRATEPDQNQRAA